MIDHQSETDSPTVAWQAPWIIPVASPPIRDGVVIIRGGVILAVGEESLIQPSMTVQQISGVITPGLVNAHTHLEFSDLAEPIGHAGISISDWIGQVVGRRRAVTPAQKTAAIKAGISEIVASGTVAVGEIATLPLDDLSAYQTDTLETTVFLERLGLGDTNIDTTIDEAQQFADSNDAAKFTPAISPHAPYSVHPDLLQRLVGMSIKQGLPVAMHLSESTEELELLQDRGDR